MPPGVLFLCVANSARSQLAEALARHRFGDRFHIQSAGTKPSRLHAMAVSVLGEDKVSTAGQHSKSVETIDPATVDLVVTLCAEEVCPVFLGNVRRAHWPIPDPAAHVSPTDLRKEFRLAKRAIRARLDALESLLGLPRGATVMPAGEGDRPDVDKLLETVHDRSGAFEAETAADAALVGARGFPDGHVLARVGGELAGVAAMTHDDERAQLRLIAVAPMFRRRGIGRALIADRLAWAKSQAITATGHGTLASVSAPVGTADVFLEHCGFSREGERLVHRFHYTNQELLTRGIAAETAATGTMVPPFAKYPDIPCMSIGWRMGDGEWYLWMWSTWFNALDPAARAAYLAEWEPKAPPDWEGWLDDSPPDDDET